MSPSNLAKARRPTRRPPSPGWFVPLAMTTTLALLNACRPPQTENPGLRVPRGLETRVVEATAYGTCRELGSPRGDLRPVDCGRRLAPEQAREFLPLTEADRDAPGAERALAAAVAVALSSGTRTLERSIASLASGDGVVSSKASAWIALGALQHAQARATGDPALLVDALGNTYRALRAQPRSPAALFNRAVIEGDLGLCRQARESWREYFALDRSSEWAEEGRIRHRALPCGQATEGTRGPGPGALAPIDRDQLVEQALEDQLPRWLETRREGSPESERELQRISERAAQLATDAGDPWLRELAQELRHHAEDSVYLQAADHYVRGRVRFRAEDYRSARRALDTARPILRSRNSVLLPWCDLWLAGIDLYEGRFPAAEGRLRRLLEVPAVERSSMLTGRVTWALGLAAVRAGRLQDAYDRYSEAETEFARGGYLSSVASMGMLKGEALADLGFVAESWHDRVAALRALQGPEPHFMLRNALLDGATVAGGQGAPLVAGAFLSEVQTLAEESDDLATAAEALLFRGEVLLEAGEETEAAASFDRALETASSLSQGLVRERFEAHARLGLWASGSMRGADDLAGLDPIIRFFAGKGPPSLQLLALRVKARLAMERGHEDLSRATVAEAIREIRRTERELREERFELRYWETAQAVFDEAVLLALSAGEPVEALGLLEEARDLAESPTGELPFETCELAEPGRTYPVRGGTRSLVLGFGVVGDELAWWRIDGDRCLYGRGDVRRSRGSTDHLLSSARVGSPATADLERLYEDLLAEPLRGVPSGVRLRLVADRHLLRIPFAALRNPETDRFLAEEHAISFHHDLDSALGAGLEATAPPPRHGWKVLAVGDPAFDRRSLPWLVRLPGARIEAELVASLYAEGSDLLLGQDATLARIGGTSGERQVLHLATHAVTSPGGMSDGLVLAGERTVSGASGLTPVRDLAPAIPRDLQLVVLSGCSTLGTTPTRSSGLAGLTQPFISQGVPAVVGTLWPLPDELLTELMTKLHAGIREGAAASDALRQAQIERLESSSDDSGLDWAAVLLYGELPAVGVPNDRKE